MVEVTYFSGIASDIPTANRPSDTDSLKYDLRITGTSTAPYSVGAIIVDTVLSGTSDLNPQFYTCIAVLDNTSYFRKSACPRNVIKFVYTTTSTATEGTTTTTTTTFIKLNPVTRYKVDIL